MICICIVAISCSHQQKTANRTAIIVKKTIVKCLNSVHSKHRSVTDPATPDPVDLFPSLNQNLASPVWTLFINGCQFIIVWSLRGMIVTDWTKVPKFVHT